MASIYSLKGSGKQKKRKKMQYDNFGKIQKMAKDGTLSSGTSKFAKYSKNVGKPKSVPRMGTNVGSSKGRKI